MMKPLMPCLSAMYDKDSAIYALSLRLKINVLKRIFAERRHLEADHLLAYRCIAQRVCYVDPGCFVVHDQLRLFIEPGTFGLVWRQPGVLDQALKLPIAPARLIAAAL